MLNIALRAARSAGELVFRSIERLDVISVNGEDTKDYVAEVDRAAEQTTVAALCKIYPTHMIIGGEGGFIGDSGGGTDYLWMIDPLDGTISFIHGILRFAVNIACRYKGHLEHAVVLNPMRQEKFTANRGRGAALNGRRLRVSGHKSPGDALFGAGFPFHNSQINNLDSYPNMFRGLVGQAAGIRRASAASLGLAYITAGRYDAFWEFGLSGWDMVADALLVQEADGLVSNFTGSHEFLEKGHIVADDTRYFKTLLTTVQPHLLPSLKR